MTGADRAIWWTTAGAVVGVATGASYEHAYALVRAHGDAGWTARLVPLTVDGMIYASSMVMLDSTRRKVATVPQWKAQIVAGTVPLVGAPLGSGAPRLRCGQQAMTRPSSASRQEGTGGWPGS
jgi:hypothetical protein